MQAQVRKLQRFIFILLLILLPTQLGYHWWPEWSLINGVRVDYFSPTVYATDVLILGLFFVVIPDLIRDLYTCLPARQGFRVKPGMTLVYCVTGLLVLLNIYFSYSPSVSIYKWLKVAEFGFFGWYIAKRAKFEARWLLIPVFYESVLAILQYINQGSVGGLWYWLGERTFTAGTPGISNTVVNGQLILRSYGTFPHPNVLAGFLIVSLLINIKYLTHISRKITAVVICFVILVVFLTLSRGDLTKGLALRGQLNNIAIVQFSNSPLLGTGIGTSPLYARNITNYALLHQPIHNIFLLVLSEMGILGLIGFLWIIKKRFSWLLLPILFLGLFDHYFLTLQQGQLLLTLVLAHFFWYHKSK